MKWFTVFRLFCYAVLLVFLTQFMTAELARSPWFYVLFGTTLVLIGTEYNVCRGTHDE